MEEKIAEVAKDVLESDVREDCFTCSLELKNRLNSFYGCSHASVVEYVLPNEYYHYIVEISSGCEWCTSDGIAVDCTFDQFGKDTNTQINLDENCDSVVVISPIREYIFYRYRQGPLNT